VVVIRGENSNASPVMRHSKQESNLQTMLIFREIRDAQSAREAIVVLQDLLQKAQLQLRNPPPEPTVCCARGCGVCVWEGFVAASENWRLDALSLLEQARGIVTFKESVS
jgi:Oxidoreductase-like protein, N-terminal